MIVAWLSAHPSKYRGDSDGVLLWVGVHRSSVKVIVVEFGLVPYPSCVEVNIVLALCLASCVEVVVLREKLYTLSL